MVGANYKLVPGLSVYGGYSESNRAPTPAELGCAEEDNPVPHRKLPHRRPAARAGRRPHGRIGLRGQGVYNGGHYTWGAGLFRTLASDDILPITQRSQDAHLLRQCRRYPAPGRRAVGDVRDAQVERLCLLRLRRCHARHLRPPERPVRLPEAGDRLPGIPRHRFKAGIEYSVTSKWKVGTDLVAASN